MPAARRANSGGVRRKRDPEAALSEGCMTIDLRMPHLVGDRLFPDWAGVKARLRAAVSAIQ